MGKFLQEVLSYQLENNISVYILWLQRLKWLEK